MQLQKGEDGALAAAESSFWVATGTVVLFSAFSVFVT